MVECPGCRKKVDPTAPACPHCHTKLTVEYPADMTTKHPDVDLPPPPKSSYDESTTGD